MSDSWQFNMKIGGASVPRPGRQLSFLSVVAPRHMRTPHNMCGTITTVPNSKQREQENKTLEKLPPAPPASLVPRSAEIDRGAKATDGRAAGANRPFRDSLLIIANFPSETLRVASSDPAYFANERENVNAAGRQIFFPLANQDFPIVRRVDHSERTMQDNATASESLEHEPRRALGEPATRGSCDRVEAMRRVLGDELARKLGVYRMPAGFCLSVVIPVYNEIKTLPRVIERVRGTQLPIEMVIVDDGSRDGSREFLADLQRDPLAGANVKVLFHERNQGKGGALKTGFLHCSGDVVVIQDADLEYDPNDYWPLLQPIVEGHADVVYGSRFSHIDGPVHHFWHRWGNQFITRLSNYKSGLALTDAETCYKMVRRELIAQVAADLRERGFGVELEITLKLARMRGVRFYERPISYVGRSWADGKKIGVKDGIWALWCILRY